MIPAEQHLAMWAFAMGYDIEPPHDDTPTSRPIEENA